MKHEHEEISCWGIKIHPWTMAETLNVIEHGIDSDTFIQHVVVNVAKVVNLQNDQTLKSSIEACDIVNIDGMGVVWGARILGFEVPERVAGVDLFYHLVEMSQRRNFPIFLLGSKPEVITKTVNALKFQFPGIIIVGSHHGYFWDEEEKVVDLIRSSGAKLLFVAITSPKKENFINRWHEQLGVNFVMGVGGTFDIVAGVTKRAPLWMQKYGLEWFYRVAQEPRRMWRRYFVTNIIFAYMVARDKICKFKQFK